MSAPDRWAFGAGYRSALLGILERELCADLFNGLQLNGLGISAMTSIGGYRTSLWYQFKVLHQNDRISILIHEALHTAGLREFPYAPEALTSTEITRMVKKASAL